MGRACNVSGVAREGGGGWKGQGEGERLATPMRSKGKDGRPGGPRGRKRRLRLCTTSTPSVPLARRGEQPHREHAPLRESAAGSGRPPHPRVSSSSPVERFIHGAILAGQSAPKSAQLQDETATVFPEYIRCIRLPHCARCLNEATSSRFFSLLLPPSPNLPRLEASRMPPPVTATRTVTVTVKVTTDRPRGGYFLLFVRGAP